MKCCMPHWEKMREAVKERGLWHCVAQSDVEATDSVERQIKGEDTVADWDPLMAMNWNFMSRALTVFGLGIMSVDEHGEEYCPLCVVRDHTIGDAEDDNWITGCADAMLKYAKEHDLLLKVH